MILAAKNAKVAKVVEVSVLNCDGVCLFSFLKCDTPGLFSFLKCDIMSADKSE